MMVEAIAPMNKGLPPMRCGRAERENVVKCGRDRWKVAKRMWMPKVVGLDNNLPCVSVRLPAKHGKWFSFSNFRKPSSQLKPEAANR